MQRSFATRDLAMPRHKGLRYHGIKPGVIRQQAEREDIDEAAMRAREWLLE